MVGACVRLVNWPPLLYLYYNLSRVTAVETSFVNRLRKPELLENAENIKKKKGKSKLYLNRRTKNHLSSDEIETSESNHSRICFRFTTID